MDPVRDHSVNTFIGGSSDNARLRRAISNGMEKLLLLLKRFIPRKIFIIFQPIYHYLLALSAALLYRFPSRKLVVVAVTGTKGKSSVVEIINAILEEAGIRTALLSTIRFKIAEKSSRNLFKMTMPGRFFIQQFLRDAVKAGCDTAIIEMTSEGVKQFRHKWVVLDALIFTNISPEHIEAHGSFENYINAKLKLKTSLESSKKRPRTIVANTDDPQGAKFLDAAVEKILPYHLSDGEPYQVSKDGVELTFKNITITSKLRGTFNIYNILAAVKYTASRGIPLKTIARGISKLTVIAGRAELVELGQPFTVVVDYAHTPESLTALYEAFSDYQHHICVLGNTGGGRDKWKRPRMSAIAEHYCDEVILTNEDPYDENPQHILSEMAAGMKHEPRVILDRREAIREAIRLAQDGNQKNTVVLISGKGTDPYIMGPRGKKVPWSDKAEVEAAINAMRKHK